MTKNKTFSQIFDMAYQPQKTMAKRFPKAAKKRRIRKKWLNKYGPDVNFSNMLPQNSPIFDIPHHHVWQGANIIVPVGAV